MIHIFGFDAWRNLGKGSKLCQDGRTSMAVRPTVFISYSHFDQVWKDRIVKHLGVLARQSLVEVWDDSRIEAGTDWKIALDSAMTRAHVAVMLVTVDFLNSEFVLREEMPRLLAQQQRQGLILYPILVKPCPWKTVRWLADIQMRPRGRAISGGSEHEIEEDFSTIAEEIYQMLGAHIPDRFDTPHGQGEQTPSIGTSPSCESGGTIRKVSPTRERIFSLISEVHSRATPLSACIAAAIPIALELNDEAMHYFCERELTSYEQPKLAPVSAIGKIFGKPKSISPITNEKQAEAVEHRVVEFHAATLGAQLNMDYFDSAATIMTFIAQNPKDFTPLKLVYPPPIARIEHDITQTNVHTFLDLQIPAKQISPSVKFPGYVHCYAPASSLNSLIERIRARFTEHLLRNVRPKS